MNTSEIDKVISGELWEIDIPCSVTPHQVVEYMKTLGYVYELDISGTDFWLYFRKSDSSKISFSLISSWYYDSTYCFSGDH